MIDIPCRNSQQNQRDAAQITYDYLQEPAQVVIWTPLEAFAEGVMAIGGSLNILHTLAQIQAGKTEGITANKDRLRKSVTRRLVRAAKAAITFGNAADNPDLVAQANALNSPTEIKEIKDGELADVAIAFYHKALAARDADAGNAAKYGFKTEADEDKLLTPLVSAITAYAAVFGSTRGAINVRANATAAIEAELRRLQSTLKDLDNLAPQFEDEHADFVSGYNRARHVIARGSGGKGSGNAAGTGGDAGKATPK